MAPPLYPPPSATLSLEGEEGGGESDAPPPSSPPAQAQDEATMPDDEALHSSEDENHTMGRTLGEGFICLVCQYKCLSPEALHTHYQVEHPSASLGYRPNNSGKGALKCACMVVEPIYSSSQKRQLAVLHSFSFFWVVVATPRGLPQDVKFKIFSFSRTDSYYDFLNFRSPEEFAKSLWPSFRASNAIRLQFYSQDFVINRSIISIGVHPISPFSSAMIDLSNSSEVDNQARKMFRLICRYGREPFALDWLTVPYPKTEDCLLEILKIIRKYPKLTNEAYALVFKQMNNPDFSTEKDEAAIIDKSIKRPKCYKNNTSVDATGEGDPGYWFAWTISNCGHPIYAMNTEGPLRYLQILYCLCHTSHPTPDFLPFVISHLKGFSEGDHNGLISLKAEEEFRRNEYQYREQKLREKEEMDKKEDEVWRERPNWYSSVTGERRKFIGVAPFPRVLNDVYRVNLGKGILGQYASCCVDMIRRVVKLGERGRPPPVTITKDHIEHLKNRPPFLTKVSLDFVGKASTLDSPHLKVFDKIHHVAPWEPNSNLKGIICKALKLKGFEAESMCLYVYIPSARQSRLAKMNEDDQSDAHSTLSIPMPVPPSFYLGDLAMNDNIHFFRLTLRRKLFFGLPMVCIPPIPRIGLRAGATYKDPLDSVGMTPVSEGLLFLQFIHNFGRDRILYGYDMPSTPFLHFIGDTWIEWLKPHVSKILCTCSSESREAFLGKSSDHSDNDCTLSQRKTRACLMNCRIAVALALRQMIPDPPVKGVKWAYHKAISSFGPGAFVEYAYKLIPSQFHHLKKKRWWEEEIGSLIDSMLPMIRTERITTRDLHEIVLFTMGTHILVGSQGFLIRKKEDPNEDLPYLEELRDLDDGERFWLFVNPIGLHVCSTVRKSRLVSIPYHKINRWSGNLKDIVLNVVDVKGGDGEVILSGVCTRSALFRQVMLEIIHSLMTHQGSGFDCEMEGWADEDGEELVDPGLMDTYNAEVEAEYGWWDDDEEEGGEKEEGEKEGGDEGDRGDDEEGDIKETRGGEEEKVGDEEVTVKDVEEEKADVEEEKEQGTNVEAD